MLTKMLATGNIKPNPVQVLPSGLVSVKEGLQYMQEGKVILHLVACLREEIEAEIDVHLTG